MSIKQIMEDKKTKAETEIRAEFWADKPDEERIAEVALAAGIEPETVALWQDSINEAKAKIRQVADVDLSGLRSEKNELAKKLKTADSKLQKAKDARQEIAVAYDRTSATLDAGRREIEATARLLKAVDAPEHVIPDIVLAVRKIADLQSEYSTAEQAARVARNTLRKWKGEVAILQTRLEAVRSSDRKKGGTEFVIHPSGFIKAEGPVAGALKRAMDFETKAAEAFDKAQKRTEEAKVALEAARKDPS